VIVTIGLAQLFADRGLSGIRFGFLLSRSLATLEGLLHAGGSWFSHRRGRMMHVLLLNLLLVFLAKRGGGAGGARVAMLLLLLRAFAVLFGFVFLLARHGHGVGNGSRDQNLKGGEQRSLESLEKEKIQNLIWFLPKTLRFEFLVLNPNQVSVSDFLFLLDNILMPEISFLTLFFGYFSFFLSLFLSLFFFRPRC
jgi:hypothetical protein